MDTTTIEYLRSPSSQFDLPHLLGLYIALTLFILLWGLLASTSGVYSTARQFWKIHLIVLGGAYVGSGIGFLLLHIDPLFLTILLSPLAFIILGEGNTSKRSNSDEASQQPAKSEQEAGDWWSFPRQQPSDDTNEEQEPPE